eukprot:scaffold3823_cov195-Amphora_coffeaeformis.AAC.11
MRRTRPTAVIPSPSSSSSSTTTTTTTTATSNTGPMIVLALEQHASAVVEAIRVTVDAIRTHHLPSSSRRRRRRPQRQSTTKPPSPPTHDDDDDDDNNLYETLSHLVVPRIVQLQLAWEEGLREDDDDDDENNNHNNNKGSSVLQQVVDAYPQNIQPSDLVFFHDWSSSLIPNNNNSPPSHNDLEQEEGENDTTTQRHKVVRQVLWPLLHYLARVYAYLDLLPENNNNSVPATQHRGQPPHRPQKPKPPPGMLSLQHYTDIACLLEFTICTSVMVLLDDHVLPTVSQRLLPKSLQGRLPRPCLSWGYITMQQHTQRQQQQEEEETTTRRSHDDNNNNTSTTDSLSLLTRWYELQGTAARVAQLVLLDRFRPMLLPRHVTDLYATIWQAQYLLAEHETKAFSNITASSSSLSLHQIASFLQHGKLYAKAWEETSLLPSSKNNSHDRTTFRGTVIDDTRLALVCQQLLQQGRQAPGWLQRQVSRTLQALSYQNLAAVTTVFCPTNDHAGAPSRLARTLLTGPKRDMEHAKHDKAAQIQIVNPLIQQVVVLLDQLVAHCCPVGTTMASATTWITEAHQTKIHVIWAILDQFPNHILTDGILPLLSLSSPNISSLPTTDIHRNVRRWTVLLLFIPPFVNLSRMGEHFLLVNHNNVIRLLFELASAPGVVQTNVKEDALYGLQLWSQAILSADHGPQVDSLEVYSLLVLYLLSPESASYEVVIEETSDNQTLDLVTLNTYTTNPLEDVAQTVANLERRAKLVVDKLIRPLSQESVAKTNTALPSRLLQVLVFLYLSFESDEQTQPTVLPLVFLTPEYKLATMTLLPLLCEDCSMETLLAEPSSSLPLLNLIGLVLHAVSLKINKETRAFSFGDKSISFAMTSAGKVVSKMLSLQSTKYVQGFRADVLDDEESKLSIASVLLTLLVGLLELGTERRQAEEESVLRSIMSYLRILSDASGHTNIEGPAASAMWSELSEMASHANALIAARDSKTDSINLAGELTDPLMKQFVQAKHDLKSPEPPVRARGVVTLRHLTFLVGKSSSPKTSLLEEKNDAVGLDLCDVIALSIEALCDKESYVYLAAIQTITAATLQEPVSVVRKLCVALATGIFRSRDTESSLQITSEQRIKLAESLVAFVRRRAALSEHLDDILGTLFHATKRNPHAVSPDESGLIQVQTHRYFTGQDREDADDMHEDGYEETLLRVKTGGPVFDKEEDDIVRGAAINLVSEVVRLANPVVITRFVPMLIECAKLALQLEASRPVRRSGAQLASCLYATAIREIEEQDPKMLSNQQVECPLLVAMVSSNENSLATLLARVETGSDLSDLDAEKGRQFDPATVARCKEALALRHEVKSTGILALAELSLASARGRPSMLEISESNPSKTASSFISIVKEI